MDVSKWDPAAAIRSEEEARIYLEEAAKEGNATELAETIDWVARAYGMKQLAAQAGMSTADLFRVLGRHPEPDLSELLRVLEAMGVPVARHSDAAE